jgi:murein DD-endopeptidase MepM/ murein hydrolase activator NlpD
MLTTQDERDRYAVYNITRGNRQYIGSPFPDNWLPYVSSNFGWRISPITGAKEFHTGVDIALPTGTEIQAGGRGVVLSAGSAGDYGLAVVIEYASAGSSRGSATVRYAHCSALLVSAGQEVRAGDPIARVGDTGTSTGSHLHAEVIKDSEFMNPLYFMVIPFN